MTVDALCPHCRKPVTFREPKWLETCPNCGKAVFEQATENLTKHGALNQCPLCGSEHLFRQKDFNRKVGVAILAVGVVLAFWTYGISLLIVTIIDWLIARGVGEVGICYRCRACYRGSSVENLPGFNLSLHDYYRSLPPW